MRSFNSLLFPVPYSLTFIPNFIVDRLFRFFNKFPSQSPKALEKHTGTIYTLAFSPDEKILSSGGVDGYIHINDDLKILVSGGDDATVHYWPVNKLNLDLEPACQRLLNHPGIKDVEGICHKILKQKKIK